MRKSFTSGLFLLMISATWAHAETSTSQGIRESNDPQRAQEIENNARQISGQSNSESGATGAATESEKATGKKKNLTRSLTKNPINALAQLLLRPEMLAREQKKIAPVTVTLNIAPETAPERVIQVVTQTLAPQPVPAIAREITTRVSNLGSNRSV